MSLAGAAASKGQRLWRCRLWEQCLSAEAIARGQRRLPQGQLPMDKAAASDAQHYRMRDGGGDRRMRAEREG
ncbi:hypothetical protein BHE74_00057026 [Ensete ventricosum]|nr:hypothetical protein BHE74_00057026 [Ensete ventricosum]RZR90964.1 hypothetical protein BHM03_00018983 [Ensete ventricosum]